jgi:hypothetical protein
MDSDNYSNLKHLSLITVQDRDSDGHRDAGHAGFKFKCHGARSRRNLTSSWTPPLPWSGDGPAGLQCTETRSHWLRQNQRLFWTVTVTVTVTVAPANLKVGSITTRLVQLIMTSIWPARAAGCARPAGCAGRPTVLTVTRPAVLNR